MRNKNDVYINPYRKFIQKLQQLEINLKILQKSCDAIPILCEKISPTVFDKIIDETIKQIKKDTELSCFSYKIPKSINLLDQILVQVKEQTKEAEDPSEEIKNLIIFKDLITFLNELDSNQQPDHIKKAALRLKQHIFLTALEKYSPQEKIVEIKKHKSLDQMKIELTNAIVKYCRNKKNIELETVKAISKNITKFNQDLNPKVTQDTQSLLSKIYDYIPDEKIRYLLDEIGEKFTDPSNEHADDKMDVETENNTYQAPKRHPFSDESDEEPFFKKKRSASPPGMLLAVLANRVADSTPLTVKLKPLKKRPFETETETNYDASDENNKPPSPAV